MCTALKYKNVMGRNFDYEKSYKEQIVRIEANEFNNKYDIIGMATGFVEDYPLLYDGMNEYGLCVAGLAFGGNAKYNSYEEEKMNVPAFDFTFYLLGHYTSCSDITRSIRTLNIWCEPYSDEMPNTDLHWFVCDSKRSLVIEQTETGLHCYEANGVMTNNPPYPDMKDDYIFGKEFFGGEGIEFGDKKWHSRGLSTNGVPGSYLSDDRFTRVSFFKEKLENVKDIFNENVEAFHLLSSVEQIYGLTPVDDKYEYTIYSIVYNMDTLDVYIKTYENLQYGYFNLKDKTLKRYTI